MKAPNLHLNLLREQEVVSSSPVRLRVLLPVLTGLACVAVLGWWGMLFAQEMMLKAQSRATQENIAASKARHDEILKNMAQARDLQAELDQLSMYRNARRTYGASFARLADVMPDQVQLLSIEIPEQPLQNLTPPNARPGVKVPPLLGPTGTVEKVSLRLQGRTPRETPVLTLMDSLAQPGFSNVLKVVKAAGPQGEASPRIHSFRQESAAAGRGGSRLLAFDIEYTCTERRFEK